MDRSLSLMPEASDIEDDHRRQHFSTMMRQLDDRISSIFDGDGSYNRAAITALSEVPARPAHSAPSASASAAAPSGSLPLPATDHTPVKEPPRKKAKRVIDDDYDDYDDDEDEDDNAASSAKRDNAAAASSLLSPSKSGSSPVHSESTADKKDPTFLQQHQQQLQTGPFVGQKSSEDARKQLEDAKTATEEAAIRSFYTMFHTLENDRTAMLEQERLDETEKQLQAEMDKGHGNNLSVGPNTSQGTLSSANLGASSLTLKHLIARIDAKREQVRASDSDLRSLMNEVRKNRSKWANEEQVGQEELYEALEKVLSELKAHTEYSTPFLTRVNKREAPDYYSIIKQPMDLGTMTKKLKQHTYKSKADFVADLNLIWDNCLRYNQDMSHPLRRMANGMRREAEKLIPLIPDIVIRPRAEVEAEERRKQLGADDEDSDDEPIMSSRGRTAGTKKGASKSRKSHGEKKEGTPNVDQKPVLQLNGLLAKHREGSEIMDGSNGFATPPVGSITPSGINGMGSNADAMDIDGPSMNGLDLTPSEEQVHEDDEYKVWKQLTKKDRARVAKTRFVLFKDGKLNADEPALLRTRAGIRKNLKRKRLHEMGIYTPSAQAASADAVGDDGSKAMETLAEGMEAQVEDESILPEYYEPLNVIPDIPPKLQWSTDNEGQVINQHEEFLQLVKPGHFIAPPSQLSKRIDSNLDQIQETRKLCSKIGVIKQMQIQAQVYNNQFSKYNPEPFKEVDVEPHFYCGDGPIMAPGTCRSAMQRSVAKLFYHAGFEELQPSALDTITDIAGDYFQRLVHTFNVYREAEKKEIQMPDGGVQYEQRFSPEEVLLHTLVSNGTDVETLENYARDDVDRLGNRLGTIHERMKAHLADLIRPALNDAGPDGVGAFNDGSDQFVSGDFAEELGDDFFGFRALGLDKEMGLEMLSVPLHLLQSRVRSQFQQTQVVGPSGTALLFEEPPPLDPVTKENVHEQVGLAKNFFLAKLAAAKEGRLVEDKDLPVKQQKPRPRLGVTGKIISPQKRPPKEQIALAKKKKKLEMQMKDASPEKKKQLLAKREMLGVGTNAALTLAPPMSRGASLQSQGHDGGEKDDGAPMSPESMER
ncbi:putative bromodomain-containing protein [Zalerion maritima]|uniref:SAGA complex subunit Spt7 n=1 Tax=Zalerion maritima TaxID=339359 RepID=A0AAD5WW04_9PEZI|nr:putative bromodomain-containing protein [Zalerion maritima]